MGISLLEDDGNIVLYDNTSDKVLHKDIIKKRYAKDDPNEKALLIREIAEELNIGSRRRRVKKAKNIVNDKLEDKTLEEIKDEF